MNSQLNNKFNILMTESSSSNNKDNNNNNKRILCMSIISSKYCIYGPQCSYAHSLDEQRVFSLRKKAYNIILDNSDLSKINLYENNDLYNELNTLSNLCSLCDKNKCTGGYNCKYGVFNCKYQICLDDLNFGICKHKNCQRIHLTNRNLTPYNIIKKIKKKENNIFLKNKKLLTDDYSNIYIDSFSSNSDSNSENDKIIKKTIMYLNRDDDNNDEESIFIE